MSRFKTEEEGQNQLEKISDIISLVSGSNSYRFFLMGLMGAFPTREENEKALSYLFEGQNLFYAKVSFISMILSFCEDKIIEKKEKESYQSKIIEDVLLNNLKYLFNIKNDDYVINGNITPKEKIVAHLRNKPAHGDLLLDANNNKVGYKVNKEGKEQVIWLDVDRLAKYAINVAKSAVHCGKNKISRPIILSPAGEYDFMRLDDIKSYMENSKCIKLVFESDNEFDLLTVSKIENFIENYKLLYQKGEDKRAENLKNIFVSKLENNGIKFTLEETVLSAGDIAELSLYVQNNIDLSNKNLNKYLINDMIGNRLDNSLGNEDTFGSISLLNANCENLKLLSKLSKRKLHQSLSEVITPFKADIYKLVSSMFAIYYSMVSFGIENVLSPTEFDYSCFDILPLVKVLSKEEHSKIKYYDNMYLQARNSKVNNYKQIKTLEASIETRKKMREKALAKVECSNLSEKKMREKKEELLIKFGNNIINLKEKKSKLENEYYEKEDKEKGAILDKKWAKDIYNEEFHLLDSIRNSITHALYEFFVSYDINSSKLKFKDMKNDNVTYDCEMTFEDFEKLLIYVWREIYPYLMYRSETILEDLNNEPNYQLTRKLKNSGMIPKHS